MGTLRPPVYGNRPVKVYPVAEGELEEIYRWALWSLFGIGLPFLVISVVSMVHRLKRETKFDED